MAHPSLAVFLSVSLRMLRSLARGSPTTLQLRTISHCEINAFPSAPLTHSTFQWLSSTSMEAADSLSVRVWVSAVSPPWRMAPLLSHDFAERWIPSVSLCPGLVGPITDRHQTVEQPGHRKSDISAGGQLGWRPTRFPCERTSAPIRQLFRCAPRVTMPSQLGRVSGTVCQACAAKGLSD